jgi:outer membrane protein assembly factor BamB
MIRAALSLSLSTKRANSGCVMLIGSAPCFANQSSRSGAAVFAFDAKTGELKWTYDPWVRRERAYFFCRDIVIAASRYTTAKSTWERSTATSSHWASSREFPVERPNHRSS